MSDVAHVLILGMTQEESSIALTCKRFQLSLEQDHPGIGGGLTVSGEGTGEGENKLCLIPEVEKEISIVFTSNERKLAAEFL